MSRLQSERSQTGTYSGPGAGFGSATEPPTTRTDRLPRSDDGDAPPPYAAVDASPSTSRNASERIPEPDLVVRTGGLSLGEKEVGVDRSE